ncbi:MAG: hypothetical protein COC12_05175 [Rhodobacteraceae bacterium]|nr:MAG: hypothetical protein COC12_05175 [Paracoccaceae bacterium]
MRFGSSIPVILTLLFFGLASLASAEGTGRARLLGSFTWEMDAPWFGGWSGIEVSPDGRQMVVISDRGRILDAQIIRKDDQITAVQAGQMQRLKSSKGVALTHKIADSEGLAIAPDGTLFISFENVIRVARYAQTTANAQVLRKHPAFGKLARNKALEALAIDSQGRLFTLPERVEPDRTIQVFVLDNNVWTTPFTLSGNPDFLPVGADFGPDGQFYLLERAFGIWGFRSRVRRWDISQAGATNQELLFETEYGTHDNLEGLTVWRDQQGRTRLTMISDDNFLSLQTTEIVEYAVQE